MVGLVLYISSINDEVMNRPSSSEQYFHYRYGWSFAFAASSFLLKEVMSVGPRWRGVGGGPLSWVQEEEETGGVDSGFKREVAEGLTPGPEGEAWQLPACGVLVGGGAGGLGSWV